MLYFGVEGETLCRKSLILFRSEISVTYFRSEGVLYTTTRQVQGLYSYEMGEMNLLKSRFLYDT
jgi:hypothetical protein